MDEVDWRDAQYDIQFSGMESEIRAEAMDKAIEDAKPK